MNRIKDRMSSPVVLLALFLAMPIGMNSCGNMDKKQRKNEQAQAADSLLTDAQQKAINEKAQKLKDKFNGQINALNKEMEELDKKRQKNTDKLEEMSQKKINALEVEYQKKKVQLENKIQKLDMVLNDELDQATVDINNAMNKLQGLKDSVKMEMDEKLDN
ncbi:hypothetical protein GC194_09090 [bacterium]|nr:hypothetical protein [bacterium]